MINGSDLSRVDTCLKIIRGTSEKKTRWQIYKYSGRCAALRFGVPVIKRGHAAGGDYYRRSLSPPSFRGSRLIAITRYYTLAKRVAEICDPAFPGLGEGGKRSARIINARVVCVHVQGRPSPVRLVHTSGVRLLWMKLVSYIIRPKA